VTWNGGSRPWYRYSRPRLGQSGPLNGQHYSIRRDYSTPAAQRPPDAKSSRNPLQTKGISRSTSDPCRTTAGPLPKQHACHTRRAGNHKPARAPRTPVKQKAWAVSRLHRRPRLTQSTLRSTVHPPQYCPPSAVLSTLRSTVHPPQYCPPSAVPLRRTGYGGQVHPSTRSARLLAGPPARPLQPRHSPHAYAGGVVMKVKERVRP
jgi:hypothetical protein